MAFYKANPPDKDQEYCETHHVIPRSFGGSDDDSNLVLLPVRIHIHCHELLYMRWKHEDYVKAGQMAMALKRFFYGKNVHKNKVKFTSKRMATIIADAKRLQRELRWITNDEENAQIHKDSPLPEGWRWGMKKNPNKANLWITDGTVNRRIRKSDPVPDGWQIGISGKAKMMWITDGVSTRGIRVGEPIPEGWRRGLPKARNKGYKTIHKDGKSKHIPMNAPVPEGWSLGTGINTTVGKIRITDGVNLVMIDKDQPIPDGWRRGLPIKNQDIRVISNGLVERRIQKDQPIPEGWQEGTTRSIHWLYDFDGKKLTIEQLAEATGISKAMFRAGFKKGETPDEIVAKIHGAHKSK